MPPATDDNRLGAYLKDRRLSLDPQALGLPRERRRTPGLRREEVARRANISVTWYTWLEQGRGGAPSADVLDRIARALMLTDVEREHLFIIGLGHPPEARYQEGRAVGARLQKVLDALHPSPALIRTATWDVVAWNVAATAVLTDYGALPPDQRNILRMMFCDPRVRAAQFDWEGMTRFVVAAFRASTTRAGIGEQIRPLVEELSGRSPEFASLWATTDVQGFGEGVKHLRHPDLGPLRGPLCLEYSAFAVDGRADLSMLVYNPATDRDASLIQELISRRKAAA